MATHAPSTGAPTRATTIPVPPPAIMGAHLHPTYVLANRAEIEAEIERLIDLLDQTDAPAEDLEPEDDMCLAGDDGCGYHLAGSLAGWGSSEKHATYVPAYGIDQSAGPVNFHEALTEHRALEMGLVRTATGWRRP